MKQDALEYNRLVDENRLLHEKIQELNVERAWLIGRLHSFGVSVTVGNKTFLKITKGGKAV